MLPSAWKPRYDFQLQNSIRQHDESGVDLPFHIPHFHKINVFCILSNVTIMTSLENRVPKSKIHGICIMYNNIEWEKNIRVWSNMYL